ncbi:plasmid maintenance protein CcdB [Pantoea sp. Al-1710]|uniref:Toxin CcdB n=1 Tax=Candidatus Pantoea communis TaxID=2608354 RepID=A0ABX0RNZ9_9GAMM|nr:MULTISPECIES: CcdB family protein [Pantoea]NIG12904.1 plasmid maintenance protein CcdB [Pantoea sp. Cy-640]NIG17395.1 plasmid maintenance protein CcdB [Pantoea communis]
MQYDVFIYNNAEVKFVVDVQSDIIDIPGFKMVAPLYPAEQFSGNVNQILMPKLFVNDEYYRMKISEMASVRENLLGEKVVSLSSSSDVINNAINMLFWGI